jgi:ubiquinone/menaquinone biosynthesis C-methylase UbiE
LPDPAFGLEVGCGTGDTARLLVRTIPRLDLLAVDGAARMIAAAKSRPYPSTRLRFKVCDALQLPDGRFDLILTQRCLINLPTWALQKQALDAIAARLVPGGRYVMCEHAQGGLDAINQTRQSIGLPVIERPWHNRYIQHDELHQIRGMALVDVRCFSAEYYFLSRIVNAKIAQMKHAEPSYDAPINQVALALDGAVVAGRYAQARVWIWQRP